MKLTKNSLFRVVGSVGILGIVITGIFGGLVAGVFTGTLVSGNIFSLTYWQSICFNRKEYNEDLFRLRDRLNVTPLEDEHKNDPSQKKKEQHSEKHWFAFFRHRIGAPMVPGPPVRNDFESNPDDPIDVINYEIACQYPPLSVLPSDSGQKIGDRPAVLPAYCHSNPIYTYTDKSTHGPNPSSHPSPTPCPSPTLDSSRKYAYQYCPSPTPSPVPSELSEGKLRELGSGPGTRLSIPLGAVGALTIHVNSDDYKSGSENDKKTESDKKTGNDKKNDNEQAEIWGSGFMIADHTFATSCHVLESLFKKDPRTGKLVRVNDKFVLKEEFKDRLYVNFDPLYFDRLHNISTQSSTVRPENAKQASSLQFKVTEYLDCSEQRGLDVAFLRLDPNESTPSPVTLFYARDESGLDIFTAKPAALITYADLIHPLDEITSEMYQCFANPTDPLCQPTPTPTPSPSPAPTPPPPPSHYPEHVSYGKFIMVDGIVMAESCGGVHLLLDTADTTVGASGALVLDIFEPVDRHSVDPLYKLRPVPLAIGLHKCCAAYFGEVSSYGPPPALKCADLKRTPVNQDVSTKSIIDDPRLCKVLEEKNVIAKLDDNTDYTVRCSH